MNIQTSNSPQREGERVDDANLVDIKIQKFTLKLTIPKKSEFMLVIKLKSAF